MYGDTTVIRGLARTLRDQAGDIRHEADSLVGRADAVHWTGLAAGAVRVDGVVLDLVSTHDQLRRRDGHQSGLPDHTMRGLTGSATG